jgi:NAD(P)-dependent dehydrogenase (short-subunit alcohol dehydrogenase family)
MAARPSQEESHEDRRIGCPGHRRRARTGPGVCPGAGQQGAAKVYGAARDPAAVTEPGVTPIALDITDPGRVAQVARQCADVSLLVNNAGMMAASTFIDAPSMDAARLEMETSYFGMLSVCRAFAPVLAASGGGAVVNMLSAGQIEVLADERSRFVKASLSRDHELIYPAVQAFWDAALKGAG